ncbi:hypothetical protein EXIGLDRAFT_732068 [Exidia glandulosa HHB12029]|uniref:Uncharacterized protein n=1 Tax=Exidia glandulosa HHB12029 TaxID=1314781 RepID=A0A165BNH1_EXIGL|nr:hypothetical protein EXIGLDRAFT_732068 [Exidia glandulosa HHB12029]
MLFNFIFVAVAFVFGASAAPAPAQNLTERVAVGNNHVLLTTDINWGGARTLLLADSYRNCFQIPDGFFGKVSSIGPDPGITCYGMVSPIHACSDISYPSITVRYPGISTTDLWIVSSGGVSYNWNDAITYLYCENPNMGIPE